MRSYDELLKHGMPEPGKEELFRFWNEGEPLSPEDAINAKCYICKEGYIDSETDPCEDVTCPLYSYCSYSSSRLKIAFSGVGE